MRNDRETIKWLIEYCEIQASNERAEVKIAEAKSATWEFMSSIIRQQLQALEANNQKA